eukprot:9228631-Ditylum_brightwellii.AAC.1
MSIEPQHLGGYEAYFQPITKLRCGPGYVVKLKNYSGWAADIMTSAHFCQMRSAFHPELELFQWVISVINCVISSRCKA